jgi:hypothetical protein
MKTVVFSMALLISLCAFGQQTPTEEAQPVVAEGKLLYKSEMASWYGTDIFLERYPKRENIGGYLSYTIDNLSKCIFFSKSNLPKIIGTMSFDSTYNVKTANVDLTERDFTDFEKQLYQIRKTALAEINSDKMFKTYENSNLNLIPLINGAERKVYVLTGPTQNGVVLIGNDYLLTFDSEGKVVAKKSLHRNLIPINYGGKDGEQVVGSMHNHLPETGDFITPTDICTLMLYEKFTGWKTHNVVSRKYLNVWNCETNELAVIPMSTIDKVSKDQEKKNKKKNRNN